MKNKKFNLFTGVLAVLFITYTFYTFKYQGGDFSPLTDKLVSSLEVITNKLSSIKVFNLQW